MGGENSGTDRQSDAAWERKERFLDAFRATHNIRGSLRASGGSCNRMIFDRWMKDDAFRQLFEEAKEDAKDNVRGEFVDRAMNGHKEPVVSAGKIVYWPDGTVMYKTVKEPIYLIRLAEAVLPEFKPKAEIEVSGSVAIEEGHNAVRIFNERIAMMVERNRAAAELAAGPGASEGSSSSQGGSSSSDVIDAEIVPDDEAG